MKIVFCGYDFSINILYKLMDDGHELIEIKSFEADDVFCFNNQLRELASKHQIPFTTQLITSEAITKLLGNGVECFVSAGYPRKIPFIDPNKAYAINIHPSFLPEGRGILPLPKIILEKPDCAGITVHKISPNFDQGDILFQERIKITKEDSSDTLFAKIIMRSPEIVSNILKDIEAFWKNAQPQTESRIWCPYSDKKRLLNFNETSDEINKKIRAFDRYGILVKFDDKIGEFFKVKTWKEKHRLPAGSIALNLTRKYIIATSDGYIMLQECDLSHIRKTG